MEHAAAVLEREKKALLNVDCTSFGLMGSFVSFKIDISYYMRTHV